MHTIALVSQKGGSGKSTLAIGLAIAAMQDGHKVCLLETDPQGTVSKWRRRRTHSEPVVETISADYEIEQKLSLLRHNGVTLTIIDTAGGINAATAEAIRASDLCLIPARPSPADIEAAAPMLNAVRTLDKPFAFILNQTPGRSQRPNIAAAALGEASISRHETPCNETSRDETSRDETSCDETSCDETWLNDMGMLALPYIVLRNDQQDALGAGLTVTEYALQGKSAEEIRRLWLWVRIKLTFGPPAFARPESGAARRNVGALS